MFKEPLFCMVEMYFCVVRYKYMECGTHYILVEGSVYKTTCILELHQSYLSIPATEDRVMGKEH